MGRRMGPIRGLCRRRCRWRSLRVTRLAVWPAIRAVIWNGHIRSVKIDTVKPAISVTHGTPDGTDPWFVSSPVSVAIAASDATSGLASDPGCHLEWAHPVCEDRYGQAGDLGYAWDAGWDRSVVCVVAGVGGDRCE